MSNPNTKLLSRIITNKLVILIITIILFVTYRLILPDEDVLVDFPYCFDDKILLNLLEKLTLFLSNNLQIRDFFLLTGFLNLDILVLLFLAYYIKFGNSFKPIVCFIFFYGLRAIFQSFFLLDYYPIYLFTYPGFRSLTVPTSRAADFFFSGHTGCAFLLTLNFKSWGEMKLFYYGVTVTFLQMFVMTTVRAHYSIDVIFGLLIAHYVWIIVSDYEELIDRVFPWCVNNNIIAKDEMYITSKSDKQRSISGGKQQMKILYV